MNYFTKHIPSFVDCDRPSPIPFDSQDDLLKLDDVLYWQQQPKFSHFALHHNNLMAILDDGYHWYVIGYIANPSSLSLPQWTGAKYRPS